MAMTLPEISQLETAKKTGQPQDLAALMALLMAGGLNQELGVESPNQPTGSNSPNQPTGSNSPTGGGGVLAPDTLSPLVSGTPSLDFIGGAGGVNEGPTSPPGPGPVTAEDIAQQIVDAVMSGKDPTSIVNNAITQNQQEAQTAQNVSTVANIAANPVGGTLSFLGGQLGGKPGAQLGSLAGKAVNTGLGFLGAAVPTNPAGPVASLVSVLSGILAQQDLKEAGRIAGRMGPPQIGFLEANVAPQSGDPSTAGVPSGVEASPAAPAVGGVPGLGVPGQGPNSGIGITDPSTMGGMLADPTNTGNLGLSVGPVGNIDDTGITSGDTGGGPSGDGASGSLLANFATNNRPPRQMHDFYHQFMGAHPRDGKKLFTAYQTVAKQVIARAKHKGQEEYLKDRAYVDFIEPISRHIDDGDVKMATDSLVRTVKDMAREYHVPIPDRYDNVLNRQTRGGDGSGLR